MGIVKVSVFQKSLTEGLNLNAIKKLAALKSDFLVLPDFFFADEKIKNFSAIEDKSQFALDWLLKLNDAYKGIIIGGTMIHREADKKYIATPIIHNGEVVDWYRKRRLNKEESPYVTSGEEPGVYILGGQRFSILLCDDIYEKEYFAELAKMGIRMVFILTRSEKKEESVEDKHIRDERLFCSPARDYGMVITKCSPTGIFFGRHLQGRSLVVTPSGISWRVSPGEERQEVLKTVMINMKN
jgi:predicted amidohydrolase